MIAPFALAIVFNVAEGVKRALPPACHTARAAKYVLQAYDVANTARVVGSGRMHEADPLSSLFGRHNPYSALVGAVVVDVVTDALTRHAPALRCALDVRQAAVAEGSLVETNSRVPRP